MPIIWLTTFPKPMKMALVRVKKPLSSFGELSVRYMSWTLRPRPVETNKMSRGGERKEMTKENRTQGLQIPLTYRRCTHKEIFPVESSHKTSACDWRPLARRQQPPQRCWSEEPFFYKTKERLNCMRFKAPCFILYCITIWKCVFIYFICSFTIIQTRISWLKQLYCIAMETF